MRLLLVLLLAGCSAAPSPALVSRLARASLVASARQYDLPASDPAVIALAKDNLEVAAASRWIGFPASEGPADPRVGKAIQAALPKYSRVEDDVRLLYAASAAIRTK